MRRLRAKQGGPGLGGRRAKSAVLKQGVFTSELGVWPGLGCTPGQKAQHRRASQAQAWKQASLTADGFTSAGVQEAELVIFLSVFYLLFLIKKIKLRYN